MKPPRYPLQAALDQREIARQGAQRALASALQAAAQEAELLRRKEAAKATLERDREDRAEHLYDPDPVSGMLVMPLVEKRSAEMRFVLSRIVDAATAVRQQKDDLARAEANVEACRKALVEADRERKAVEKHYDTWLAEWKTELARKEQRQSDELALARHAAERSEGGAE